VPQAATWNVLDRGAVPADAPSIPYDCPGCGREAALPAVGTLIAMTSDGGIVWDGPRKLPKKIRCRRCRRTYEVS
jgi:hypothetical protein